MTNEKVTLLHRTQSWRTLAAFTLAMAVLAGVAAIGTAYAQTYKVLYNFGGLPGDPEGCYFVGLIVEGRDGNLYTTCHNGGTYGGGAAFKITTQGKLTVLYNFVNDLPSGGLMLGTDGYFYGTTEIGGSFTQGTLFKLGMNGSLATLYTFSQAVGGALPYAAPVEGLDGNLYGTVELGGSGNLGTIYKFTPSGEYILLYQFDGSQGARPAAPLIQATDGSLYGTTYGYAEIGTYPSVFKITPSGALTTVYYLPIDGDTGPDDPVMQGRDGNFYGTSFGGGIGGCSLGCGLVFKLTPAGEYTVLHNFTGGPTDGDLPTAGLVQATDGNFYGTTASGGPSYYAGTIYRITQSGDYSVIYNFDGTTGSDPGVTLVQHTNGLLYGETGGGGLYSNGVFFSLDVGARPFVRVMPFAARPGTDVQIFGQGFKGATNVAFNGIAATFTVRSDSFLTATVPSGASSGLVTVTISKGILKSDKRFLVAR